MTSRWFKTSAVLLTSALLGDCPAKSQHESVVSTVHNLSVTGPGRIKSETEREVCKFCHIPHSAVVPSPLWGHRLSDAEYQLPELRAGLEKARPVPQPDGASRLCLSCHDGTVALGDVGNTGQRIPFNVQDRVKPGDRGFLGTDLSGSHPISFVLPDDPAATETPPDTPVKIGIESDMAALPLSALRNRADVRIDQDGKMQCTTCHEPHRDLYYEAGKTPRFWVKPTVEEVCFSCHILD